MSKKLSKEDFDATFEAFLTTSISSEEDTEKINELLRNPKKAEPKGPGLWWLDDEDKKKGAPGKKSFLKSSKPVSSETPFKVKSSDNVGGSAKSAKSTKVKDIVKSGKTDRTKTKGSKEMPAGKSRAARGRGPGDASMSKDSLEDISEKSEEHEVPGRNAFAGVPDSTLETTQDITDGAVGGPDSERNPERPGFDTLDELAEKHRFFQDLEGKANGTLDYSQLNRDLSQTGNTFSPGTAMKAGDFAEDEDMVEGEEEEPSQLTPQEPLVDLETSLDKNSSQQKPSMLSKVSLLDSMDSTLNTSASPQVPGRETESRDTTQENFGQTLPDTLKTQGTPGAIGTNTSKEIEELQRVLREAGMSPTLRGPETGGNVSGKDQTKLGKEFMRPVDRSVGDILKEMDEIHQRQKAALAVEDNIRLMSDYKSPRSPRTAGHQKQTKGSNPGGFDHSHSEDTEVHKPSYTSVTSEKKTKKHGDKALSRGTISTKATEDQGKKPSKDRFSHVQSSGYGKRSPDVSPRRSQTRSSSLSPIRPTAHGKPMRSSSEAAQHRGSASQSPSPRQPRTEMRSAGQTAKTKSLSKPSLSQQEQTTSKLGTSSVPGGGGLFREDILIKELRDLREQYHEEREKNARLVADAAARENEFGQQLESQRLVCEAQISDLKRENFVISAKLKEYESLSGTKYRGAGESANSGGDGDGASDARIRRMEKECQEQEELLARFQAENKRLYEEIRNKEKAVKLTEEAMFKENQRLVAELTSVKSQLEQREVELRTKGIITSLVAQQQTSTGNAETSTQAARSSHLEEELGDVRRQHKNALREMKVLQQSHTELEQHVDALVMEREMLKKQLGEARHAKPEELKNLEQKHKEETERLTRKLKWYAENQELLDGSIKTIRERDDQIQGLKARIEELQTETGKRLEENRLRSKEKAADAKKIQDLQRQIKEMEQIIHRRHPNSLPALMMVAANTDDSSLGVDGRSRTVGVLEKRIKKLETDLDKKDEETGILLRAMEQKYNAVKFQFEERIADLDGQLRMYTRPGDTALKQYEHPHSHTLALERELESMRERYKRQVADLGAEVDRLTAELSKLKKQYDNEMRSEQARWQQLEVALRAQIQVLEASLREKDKDLRTIEAATEGLKSVPNSVKNIDKKFGKRIAKEENYGSTVLNTFSESKTALFTKEYRPQAFADEHIADIIKENEVLKNRMEFLQLEKDQERVNLRRSLAETEATARRSREDFENQIEGMRVAHEKELNRLRAEQALIHSSSKIAALQSRCDSQEVMLQHLQRQLAQREAEVEQMAALKKQESELKAQVEMLQEKLREAKRMQAPEMRHYEALEEKISLLMERHTKREQELEALVHSSQMLASQDLIEEVARWKNMVDVKNLEINKFREELDSILEVLRELQRQGVKLPIGSLR